MAAGFSVKDALNKNSKAGIDESPRARFRTKDISIFKMYRNDMNFYSVEQIEELAGDILMYGLKQNLELVYAPCEMGEYRIVAGERRWEALKYLVSKGYKEFELATSKLTTPQDDDEEQVEIIIANAYRTKTVSDMIEEETRLKASLERMKAAGKKIKGYDLQSGRLREVISSMLHMSKTKVAQIEAVNNNLIPEWKEELKGERLTFSAAYELSGMTEDEQREALGKFTETGELTHKDVKDMKAEKAAGQQVSESDTEAEIGMNRRRQKRATIMKRHIRRESHQSAIPAPNMRHATSRPEHVPHATSTRTVQRRTRPTSRDIQRNRMQSTVRQRKNSVRWSRRRK
jgi:ParB family chromosome partitioning protein